MNISFSLGQKFQILNLERIDLWSNETIKNSFLGKFIHFILSKSKANPGFKKFLFTSLITSIYLLFISLCLPQFANDRYGIGLIIIFSLGLFLLNLFQNNFTKTHFNIIDFLIFVFLLNCLVSTSGSYFSKESIVGFLKYFIYFINYLILKITFLNCHKSYFVNLWRFIYFSSIIISIIGIYQHCIGVEPLANWEDPNVENIHTRVYSTLGNPNLLAGFLLLIFPIGLILPFKLKTNYFDLFLTLMGSLLIFLCIIFTGSRGAYISLIISSIISTIIFSIYLITHNKLKNKLLLTTIFWITIMVFFIVLINLFPVVTERISTIFTLREHSSNNFRINVWLSCLKMLRDNFLIGIGPGNETFRQVYGLYMTSNFEALSAYNILLEFAIEVGIIGTIAFILIFLASFLKLHYLFWVKNSFFAFGIFISILASLIHGMVDTVFFRPQIFIPFWFLIASIAKIENEDLS